MSVQSHGPRVGSRNTTEAGRAPYSVAPPRICTECGQYASWLVPEVQFCSKHIPLEYVEIARRRFELWEITGALAWEQVLETFPVEGSSDEGFTFS